MDNLTVKSIQVKKGDTLWAIAEEHLGDGQRWREIFQWNVISMMETTKVPSRVSPDYIIIGQVIKILVPEPIFEPSGN